jgi:hypothetical protein
MILIIPRIPETTTEFDIKQFITPALLRWFRKPLSIDNIRIVIYKDTKTDGIEYHALIYTGNNKTGRKIIRKLNAQKLLNKPVAVREYHIRHHSNERRSNHALKVDMVPELGKRQGDRRRGQRLQEITNAPQVLFESNKVFAQKQF